MTDKQTVSLLLNMEDLARFIVREIAPLIQEMFKAELAPLLKEARMVPSMKFPARTKIVGKAERLGDTKADQLWKIVNSYEIYPTGATIPLPEMGGWIARPGQNARNRASAKYYHRRRTRALWKVLIDKGFQLASICEICGEMKPYTQFDEDVTTITGIKPICLGCEDARAMEKIAQTELETAPSRTRQTRSQAEKDYQDQVDAKVEALWEKEHSIEKEVE